MLKRALQIIVLVPLGLVIVALSVANRQAVTFSLDPLGEADPALSFQVPLFLLLLGFLIVGAVAGGIAAWINQGKWRRNARTKRGEAARWKLEAQEMRRQAELTARHALPPSQGDRDAA